MPSDNPWLGTDLAWMAGLYEGEGSVVFNRTAISLRMNMTDQDVLESFCRRAGLGVVRVTGPYQHKGNEEHWTPYFQLQYSSRHTYALLVAMWPWLHERRRRQAAVHIKRWLGVPTAGKWKRTKRKAA